MQEIKRGDICYADLGENEGSEQRGNRPVLIIQNDVGNTFSPTAIVAAVTDAIKRPMPTHVKIKPFGKLYKPSVVMLEQIRTIDKTKIDRKIAELSPAVMSDVDEKIKISLGLVPVKVPQHA